jgi:ferredoxin
MITMVKVNKEKCIGCGLCASLCSDVFSMGSDGKAKVKAQKKIPCVKEAIESCPVSAISE